jgi:hypothetical protein
MKNVALLFVLWICLSSFMETSELYTLGYNTGIQLGSTETYPKENFELYQATINLNLGPGYEDYIAGVREGYLKSYYVGTMVGTPTCMYWSAKESQYIKVKCGTNVE